MIGAKIKKGDGTKLGEVFLLDSGADRTILTYESFLKLGIPGYRAPTHPAIAGLGGEAEFLQFESTIYLESANGDFFEHRGEFYAVKNDAALDICLLGRDILDQFDVIFSRRNNEILLLNGNHRYTVAE